MFSGSLKWKPWKETSQAFLLISAQCFSFVPLRRSENLRSSIVSRGYKIGTLRRNRLNYKLFMLIFTQFKKVLLKEQILLTASGF